MEGKKISVNQLGEHLIDTLKKYSEKITSEELTREFETKLDGIMKAEVKKDKIIAEAKSEVSSILDDIDANKIKIGEELYAAYRESMIVGKCKCGGNLIMINSQKEGVSWVVLLILSVNQLIQCLVELRSSKQNVRNVACQ